MIHNSDIWFLITDGEVSNNEVHRTANLGQEVGGAFACAIIFLIVASLRYKPSHANLLVGITSFEIARMQYTSSGIIEVIEFFLWLAKALLKRWIKLKIVMYEKI